MAPTYKFALIQLQSEPVSPAKNFAKAEKEIRKAAAQGCHLAVLPEYHLTSWAPEHPDFISSSAESEAYLPRYQDLARELNINIVPGTICESHPAGPHAPPPPGDARQQQQQQQQAGRELRNMAHFVEAGTGLLLGSYQKKNLWHPERPHLTPGRHQRHAAFDTPLGRAGMLVCWDLAFPEAFRQLVADGAVLVVVPSCWLLTDLDDAALALNPDSEKVFLGSACVARAFENTACVVFCNSGGLSQVALPIVGARGVLGVGEDGVSVVEVDMDVLRVAEENYRVREDIAGSGWHYGYELVKGGKTHDEQ